MTINKINFCCLFFVFIYFLPACKKEPVACATADKTLVAVGEEITFTNCSVDADEYKWNFGDGLTSGVGTIAHAYDVVGIYAVTLSAYSEDKELVDEVFFEITVGEKYMAKIKINSLNFKDENGNQWDTSGGPDCYFLWGPVNSQYEYATTPISEVSTASLPIEWDVSDQNIKIEDKLMTYTIADDDGNGNYQNMMLWIANFYEEAETFGLKYEANDVEIYWYVK